LNLAWITSSKAPTLSDDIVEKLSKPSVKPKELTNEAIGPDLMVIDESVQQLAHDWMSRFRAFLDNQTPSDDNTKVEHIVRKSRMYHLIDGVLYQQGATT
jgi:hypothetical protein